MKKVLTSLGLESVNAGTWLGAGGLSDSSAPLIESVNPADGRKIAAVRSTTRAEYEQVLRAARTSFSPGARCRRRCVAMRCG